MKDRIKHLRKALGLTQDEFANKLNVKRGAIANYEIGRNEPIDAVISLICREFNVNERWLRFGEGDMFVPDPGDELDRYLAERNADPRLASVIRRFASLPEDVQQIVLDAVSDAVAEWNAEDAAKMQQSEREPDDDLDAEVAEYRRERELEKRAAAESSESSSSNVG